MKLFGLYAIWKAVGQRLLDGSRSERDGMGRMAGVRTSRTALGGRALKSRSVIA
jgi:hypothetical protein